MEDAPNQGESTPQGGDAAPPSKPDDAASDRERRLIEAALEGARPASGWPASTTAWFEGAPLPPHGAFPGYDIVREIHRGGQGVVYQAVQLSTRRHVAVKVMHTGPFIGSSGRARFEREVQVLGQLDHPNIVRIHDSGVTPDGSCFYVMDYISGKPLDKLMEQGQLPVREALRLFAKICDAVNAAHLKGVIHRDLKPSNIRIDKHGEPIVVDFGLAKLAIPDLNEDPSGSGRMMSMTGQFIGSLPWASPEQAEGSPSNIDVRTDVYSLGVILYQLLTSRFPYEVLGNMRDVLDNILRAEPARPSTIRRQVNDEVETIVLKALAKQRDRRYQSAGELGRDVQRFLEGQPIEAKRDSGWYVLTKTLKRYRVPVALASVALVALVVFAITITYLYRDAKTARDIARQQTIAAQRAQAAEAQQRQLAEARLDAAYDLATVMLTDFYDAIRELRGATAAKQALTQKAVATLDTLEADAQGDRDRLLLIAQGRLRLGNLYAGRAEMHRIGGPGEGLALFVSGLGITDALVREHPGWFAALLLRADVLAAIAHAQRLAREYEASTTSIEEAIVAFDRAVDAAGPGTPDRHRAQLARADAMLELGGLLGERGQVAQDPADQTRWAERSLEAYERGGSLYADAALVMQGVQRDRARLGQAQALIRQGHTLVRRADAKLADDPALALDLLGRGAQGLEQSASTLDDLIALHPASSVYAQSAMVARDTLGNLLNVRARALEARAQPGDAQRADEARREAIDLLGRAIEDARRASDADQANVTLPRNVAHLLNKRGRAYEDQLQPGQAEADYRESIRIREALVLTDPTGQHLNDAAVGWYRLGSFLEARAEAAQPDPDRELLARSLEAYEKALGFVLRQIDQGISPDNTNLTAIQARADAVRARLSDG
ncbi:MAG: protein kinase [Phycisphaeraceae bacterium]|nr:protein kinase [Phycisphaeraceae bacterium]